jgi:hypothetical protein
MIKFMAMNSKKINFIRILPVMQLIRKSPVYEVGQNKLSQ